MFRFVNFTLVLSIVVIGSRSEAKFWKLEGQLLKRPDQVYFVLNPDLRIMKSYKIKARSAKVAEDLSLIESEILVQACLEGDKQPEFILSLEPLLPSKAALAVDKLSDNEVPACSN